MEEVISQLERRPLPKPENIKLNELYRKPTYDEVIGYIETEPNTIKYPDRQATFLRNSFELSFLDKFNDEMLDRNQKELLKYQIAQEKIRQLALQNGTSVAMELARNGLTPPWWQYRTPQQEGGSSFQTPTTPQRPAGLPPQPPADAGGVAQQMVKAKAKAKAMVSPEKHYIGDEEDDPTHPL